MRANLLVAVAGSRALEIAVGLHHAWGRIVGGLIGDIAINRLTFASSSAVVEPATQTVYGEPGYCVATLFGTSANEGLNWMIRGVVGRQVSMVHAGVILALDFVRRQASGPPLRRTYPVP